MLACGQYCPLAHAVGALLPEPQNELASHMVGADERAAQYEPAGHVVFVLMPSVGQNVPATHSTAAALATGQ